MWGDLLCRMREFVQFSAIIYILTLKFLPAFIFSFSVAVVIAALAGPQWLFTEEKMTNENYNGTHNYDLKDYGAYLTKYTKSSLWILCSRFHGECEMIFNDYYIFYL